MTPILLKPYENHQIIYHGVTWQQFKLIDSGFANRQGIRLSYYQGVIEIMSTSLDHEFIKTMIGALLEFYFFQKEIEFFPSGECTQEREGELSLQADESYSFVRLKTPPDLSIEVVITSGGMDKLAKYRALGTPEVWFWQDGRFKLYRLRHAESQYEQISKSEWLPDLNVELLSQCILMSSPLEAKRAFQKGCQS